MWRLGVQPSEPEWCLACQIMVPWWLDHCAGGPTTQLSEPQLGASPSPATTANKKSQAVQNKKSQAVQNKKSQAATAANKKSQAVHHSIQKCNCIPYKAQVRRQQPSTSWYSFPILCSFSFFPRLKCMIAGVLVPNKTLDVVRASSPLVAPPQVGRLGTWLSLSRP